MIQSCLPNSFYASGQLSPSSPAYLDTQKEREERRTGGHLVLPYSESCLMSVAVQGYVQTRLQFPKPSPEQRRAELVKVLLESRILAQTSQLKTNSRVSHCGHCISAGHWS